MTSVIKYDAACRALAAANFDEAKDIRDKAMAMKVYARQANNKQLEADAFEIRKRAEHRLGQLIEAQPKNTGAKGVGTKVRVDERPTLADLGIGKHLADRARKLVALSSAAFEKHIAEGREDIYRSVERTVFSLINRRRRHQRIAAKANLTLSNTGPFTLIYADPPWKWGHFGQQDKENEAGKDRTPDQHYPTLTYDQIKDFRVAGKHIVDIVHKDAVLFLWCTAANLKLALDVMQTWDFTYKTHSVWVKNKTGLGLVFRNAHELLLYGTRGSMPGPQYQPSSVFVFPRGRHSAKPPEIRADIEKMYPDFSEQHRLELFAREQTKGWTAYGYEACDAAA